MEVPSVVLAVEVGLTTCGGRSVCLIRPNFVLAKSEGVISGVISGVVLPKAYSVSECTAVDRIFVDVHVDSVVGMAMRCE